MLPNYQKKDVCFENGGLELDILQVLEHNLWILEIYQ